jgi:hypothetical protein
MWYKDKMTDISILTHLYVDMQRLTSDSSNICRAYCVFILRNSVPRLHNLSIWYSVMPRNRMPCVVSVNSGCFLTTNSRNYASFACDSLQLHGTYVYCRLPWLLRQHVRFVVHFILLCKHYHIDWGIEGRHGELRTVCWIKMTDVWVFITFLNALSLASCTNVILLSVTVIRITYLPQLG